MCRPRPRWFTVKDGYPVSPRGGGVRVPLHRFCRCIGVRIISFASYGRSSFPNLQKLNYLTSFQTVTANCRYGLVCGWRISYCPVLVGTVWCDISFYCVYFGYEGRFGWFFVLARAHRRPLCRSISVIVVFTGWARAAFVKSF